jgi:putative spermidine/putrescine transport system ATP-binding protein
VFEAKVEEQIYLGDHMRTRVRVCGDDNFIVKVPNAAGHVHIVPGDTVSVGWHAEDCRALDALQN